jgi:hypothetical protein
MSNKQKQKENFLEKGQHKVRKESENKCKTLGQEKSNHSAEVFQTLFVPFFHVIHLMW